MSTNCISCVVNDRTGTDLLCDECRMGPARYWVAWSQPTPDWRPIDSTPVEPVLGWWKSGEDADGVAQLCALVSATSAAAAKTIIGISWPEAGGWRFADRKTADWTPGDRFPALPWMLERMAAD